MIDQSTLAAMSGATVRDPAGEKIGKVSQVYLDDQTGTPEWVTVRTGLFGGKESFVPLADADMRGDDLVIATEKATVSGAPRVDEDDHLSEEQETELYRYYGLTDSFAPDASDTNYASDTGYGADQRTDLAGTPGVDGQDTSGPTTDDAMTRSEEELEVGTAQRERGRARLRKYVTTEQQTVTVPVQREEVRVEREPITDANLDAATSGPAISEEEHEVTLHEEEPVVEKRAVPKERVRLDTETVTEERQVSEEVRKEQIEVDGDQSTDRDDRV
jgi:uncharacterized protein (TIGR02271 family)